MPTVSLDVPEGYVCLVEEHGKYAFTAGPGALEMDAETQKVHAFSQSLWGELQKEGQFLKVSPHLWDLGDIRIRTRDGIPIELNTHITFRIKDAYRAAYEVDPLPYHFVSHVSGLLCKGMAGLEMDDLSGFNAHSVLQGELLEKLDDSKERYGIEILGVSFGPFEYPEQIESEFIASFKAEQEHKRTLSQYKLVVNEARTQATANQILGRVYSLLKLVF
jgi:regulator of protease activity HflC (stomatin/prohibitin superfamily)